MSAPALSNLEQQRQDRIRANQERMRSIGLLETAQGIQASQTEAARSRRKPAARASAAARRAAGDLPAGRVRRSERVAGIDAPNYNENARVLAVADGEGSGGRDRRLMRENVSEEIYGLEHLDALGSHKQDWELFVDGYDAQGNRVYDKVRGQTCHQCRQKTMGKRTCCAGCSSLQGVLCGDCLFMRYGENVDEVNANPDWRCPLCRDICNCSFHRSRRGWAPTGTLYRHAIAEGYTSVAHYLVLNNLSDDAKPAALERGLCPPELAAELKKELKQAESATAVAPAAEPGQQQPAQQQEEQAAAVQEQLLQPEAGSQLPLPAAQPRRSGRGGSAQPAEAAAAADEPADADAAAAGPTAADAAAAEAPAPAAAPEPQAGAQKRRRQATIAVTVVLGKKAKGAVGKAVTVAAKATSPKPAGRRGLRSTAAC